MKITVEPINRKRRKVTQAAFVSFSIPKGKEIEVRKVEFGGYPRIQMPPEPEQYIKCKKHDCL